ncbi:hypothetical protein A3Q56_02082, partial [Intoshia linei]
MLFSFINRKSLVYSISNRAVSTIQSLMAISVGFTSISEESELPILKAENDISSLRNNFGDYVIASFLIFELPIPFISLRDILIEMDIEKLKTEAEKYGTVVDVNLPVKPDSTECRGFGFVQYQNEDDMKNAIKIFNGKKTFDRKLKCMISVSKNEHCIHKEIGKSETPKEKRKQIGENETIEKPPIKKVKQYDKADAVEGNTLFIRNLSYDTKKEELHSLFSSYGDINYVTLLKNDNGQCKGTAFIKYKRKSSVNDILDDFEKNPATFNLNYIQFDVKRALTKEKIESIGNLSKLKDASSRNLHLFREGAIRNADELQNMTKKDRV